MTNPAGAAVAAPSPTARPTAAYSALLAVVFLVVFAASCLLLQRCLPFPDVPIVRNKLAYLARHGDQYDVLFLGSSRVQFQIMPTIFDRIAGEEGVVVKSFNAGAAGMRSPEDAYFLEAILRCPHHRLRWVIVELSRLGTGLNREGTLRFRYWHDTARLKLIARRLWGQAIEEQASLERNRAATPGARYEIWSTMAGALSGHVRYWLICAINFGCGSDALNHWLRPSNRRDDADGDVGEYRDGWVPAWRDGQQMTPQEREKYQQTYADRLATPAAKERGDEVSQSALEQLLATILKAGAVPVLLIPPTTNERNFYPTEARERELEIFDFSDLHQNAELFAPERRIDGDHLNTEGAELFSAALARRFVERAKQKGNTP